VSNLPPQDVAGSCDNKNNNASSGFMNRDGAAFASFLGT
jgi:hypothetical protein